MPPRSYSCTSSWTIMTKRKSESFPTFIALQSPPKDLSSLGLRVSPKLDLVRVLLHPLTFPHNVKSSLHPSPHLAVTHNASFTSERIRYASIPHSAIQVSRLQDSIQKWGSSPSVEIPTFLCVHLGRFTSSEVAYQSAQWVVIPDPALCRIGSLLVLQKTRL